MTIDIKRMEAELKADARRFLLLTIGVGVACFAAGAALATLVFHLTGSLK